MIGFKRKYVFNDYSVCGHGKINEFAIDRFNEDMVYLSWKSFRRVLWHLLFKSRHLSAPLVGYIGISVLNPSIFFYYEEWCEKGIVHINDLLNPPPPGAKLFKELILVLVHHGFRTVRTRTLRILIFLTALLMLLSIHKKFLDTPIYGIILEHCIPAKSYFLLGIVVWSLWRWSWGVELGWNSFEKF